MLLHLLTLRELLLGVCFSLVIAECHGTFGIEVGCSDRAGCSRSRNHHHNTPPYHHYTGNLDVCGNFSSLLLVQLPAEATTKADGEDTSENNFEILLPTNSSINLVVLLIF